MKKMLKVIIVALILSVLATSLAACGGIKKEDIIGHWEVHDRVLNFDPDGTFSMSSSREGGAPDMSDLDAYKEYAQNTIGHGSWELYGNTVKTETDKYGFIDFIYKDGKLIDKDDAYTKEDIRVD